MNDLWDQLTTEVTDAAVVVKDVLGSVAAFTVFCLIASGVLIAVFDPTPETDSVEPIPACVQLQ